MPNIGSILSSARSAISAHQVAMQTITQNIANAETPGYSRQRAELVPANPQRFPMYTVGTGVAVADVARLRNQFLDVSYRREAGRSEAYNVRTDLLGEIESLLNEPSETGLASTMDRFWSSWDDLANNPTNPTAQGVVRLRGEQVAYTLNGYDERLTELSNRTRAHLTGIITEVNTLGSQVATLNRQITAAEAGGQQSPDLRDTRDRIADQLSKLAGVQVQMQANGTMSVHFGSMMLVDAANARTLEVRNGTTTTIGYVGDPDPLHGIGGQAGEMMSFLNSDAPALRARLDSFARGLVNGVNEYHASGWTAAGDALGGSNWNTALGPTGSRINFFDAAGTSAATIRISAEVAADASVIAAGDVQNAPGNNTLALAMGALRDDVGMAALQTRMGASFGTLIGFGAAESFADHYTSTVTGLGVKASDAKSQYTVFETLTAQADNRRSSENGVSLDEELTLMLRHQQAYTAATRLVRVADEMAQSILNMV